MGALRVFDQKVLQIPGSHIAEPVVEGLLGSGEKIRFRALGKGYYGNEK
jgi:hypothetical protein